ncbi:MAG TPA: hypothetical protein VG736_03025 [Vicinamibacterales bacterium]|jgi:hypothetical protein|nr:hypothetical protein [Vicinamibacterales bacterium]
MVMHAALTVAALVLDRFSTKGVVLKLLFAASLLACVAELGLLARWRDAPDGFDRYLAAFAGCYAVCAVALVMSTVSLLRRTNRSLAAGTFVAGLAGALVPLLV